MEPILNLEGFESKIFAFTEQEVCTLSNLKVPLPKNETNRMKVLKETQLLDTDDENEDYDRFTHLCRRVFDVEICLISLIDVHRQWFKSHAGLEVIETERDAAFCTYVILETTPDIMVVPDALEDERFKTNRLVTGFPHIRFYAGCALIIDGVKIGTLCLIDSKPRHNFGEIDLKNLKDISIIITDRVKRRRHSCLETEMKMAKLLMSIVYTLKFPLKSVTNLLGEIKLATEFNEVLLMKVNVFHTNMKSLITTTETILNVALASVEASTGPIDDLPKCLKPKECNILSTIEKDFASISLRRYGLNKCTLEIDRRDNSSFNSAIATISYPDLISSVFVTIFDNVADKWINVDIKILYIRQEQEVNDFSNQMLNSGYQGDVNEILFGDVCIELDCTSWVNTNAIGEDLTSEVQHADNVLIKFVTNFIGGKYETSTQVRSGNSRGAGLYCKHSLTFPCYLIQKKHIEMDLKQKKAKGASLFGDFKVVDAKALLKNGMGDDSDEDDDDDDGPKIKQAATNKLLSAQVPSTNSTSKHAHHHTGKLTEENLGKYMKPGSIRVIDLPTNKFFDTKVIIDDGEMKTSKTSTGGDDSEIEKSDGKRSKGTIVHAGVLRQTLSLMNYIPNIATRIYPDKATTASGQPKSPAKNVK